MAAYEVPPSPDYIPGPEVPPSPDYIFGPEEPQLPPPLDFIPELMYPEYISQEDEILPAEEQPLPVIDLGPRCEVGESSAAAAARPIGGRRADYRFVSTMDTEIRRQRAEEVSYGIRDVWIDPREAIEEVAPMTLEGVNTKVTELATVQEQDTQDIYAVIGDTQDRQT
ncbi:hypothetical protein Tco_0708934 [Tanacetum coccineum]